MRQIGDLKLKYIGRIHLTSRIMDSQRRLILIMPEEIDRHNRMVLDLKRRSRCLTRLTVGQIQEIMELLFGNLLRVYLVEGDMSGICSAFQSYVDILVGLV